MKRRNFLQTLGTGAAAAIMTNPLVSCAGETKKTKSLPAIGYISGMVPRELWEGDWKAAMTRTVEMGYSEIQISNYFGESAESFIDFCNSIGMKPISGNATFSRDMDEVNKSLDLLNEMNIPFARVGWPWLTGEPVSVDDVKVATELLQKIGELCKQKALIYCWHNHAFEFHPIEGVIPFNYIMDNTDSNLVKCELDLYWVKRGGADPVEILNKYNGRYPVLHVKDMAPGWRYDFECVGSGIIDFQVVLAEAMDQNIKHYIVERDNIGQAGMDCLESAAVYLKSLRF